ncbi:MAG: DNA-3-methyladenine glycosylase family protein [Acidimicrobiales bacterium]
MSSPSPRASAAERLVLADPAFRDVVEATAPLPRRRPTPIALRFAALVESITYQMLAGSAAAAIHGRLVGLLDGEVSPALVAAAGVDRLRGAGLTRTKAVAMTELARATLEGRIRPERHGRLSDEEVIAEVTQVPGIGPWTGHMYLLFDLARPDVWPTGDYGVRAGWSRIHGLDEPVPPRELGTAGFPFAGYRSTVAWYCWRALESPGRAG